MFSPRTIIVSSLVFFAAAGGYCQTVAPQTDLAKVTDLRTRAALGEIAKKQAAIREIVIDDYTSTIMQKGKIVQEGKAIVRHRLPDLLYIEAKNTGAPGDVDGVVYDGKWQWGMHVMGPVRINQQIERMKQANMAQADIDKTIQQIKVSRSKIDLQKMREAGFYDKVFGSRIWYLYPMKALPVREWRLVGESPDAWLFMVKFMQPAAQNSPDIIAKLEFSKANGLCVRREMGTGDMVNIDTIAAVTVNPARPIDNKFFKYEPPAGAIVTDRTDAMLKTFQKAMKQ
ncbi:hypothetical protein LLG95_01440 [bacterium]|nr:hypothetical protein [bacterium]